MDVPHVHKVVDKVGTTGNVGVCPCLRSVLSQIQAVIVVIAIDSPSNGGLILIVR